MQIVIEFLHAYTCVIQMAVKPLFTLYRTNPGIYDHVRGPKYWLRRNGGRAVSHVKIREENYLIIYDFRIDVSVLRKANVHAHFFSRLLICAGASFRSLMRFNCSPIKSGDSYPHERAFRKLPTFTCSPVPFESGGKHEGDQNGVAGHKTSVMNRLHYPAGYELLI